MTAHHGHCTACVDQGRQRHPAISGPEPRREVQSAFSARRSGDAPRAPRARSSSPGRRNAAIAAAVTAACLLAVVASAAAGPRTYGLGATQRDNKVTVRVDLTSTITQLEDAMPISPSGDTLFAVTLTITNTGDRPMPQTPTVGAPALSRIYALSPRSGSRGRYVSPFPGVIGSNLRRCGRGVFEQDIGTIPPRSAITGCEAFAIPAHARVTAFRYGALQWSITRLPAQGS